MRERERKKRNAKANKCLFQKSKIKQEKF